jgi:hypothetical protein
MMLDEGKPFTIWRALRSAEGLAWIAEDAFQIVHSDGNVTTDPELMFPTDSEIVGRQEGPRGSRRVCGHRRRRVQPGAGPLARLKTSGNVACNVLLTKAGVRWRILSMVGLACLLHSSCHATPSRQRPCRPAIAT